MDALYEADTLRVIPDEEENRIVLRYYKGRVMVHSFRIRVKGLEPYIRLAHKHQIHTPVSKSKRRALKRMRKAKLRR